jgi:hypothetical protein
MLLKTLNLQVVYNNKNILRIIRQMRFLLRLTYIGQTGLLVQVKCNALWKKVKKAIALRYM